MSSIRRFDHVGITVADPDTATAFFAGLGLEVIAMPREVERELTNSRAFLLDSH